MCARCTLWASSERHNMPIFTLLFRLLFRAQVFRRAAQLAAQQYMRRTVVLGAGTSLAARGSSALVTTGAVTRAASDAASTVPLAARVPTLVTRILGGLGVGAVALEIADWFGFSFPTGAVDRALEAVGLDPSTTAATLTEDQTEAILAALTSLAPTGDERRILSSIQATAPETEFTTLLHEIQSGAEVVNAVEIYRELAVLLRVPTGHVDRFMSAIEGWLNLEADDKAAAAHILRGAR